MSYQLGIDLGTTYTAAAVCRSTDQRAADPEMVTLGTRAAVVPSVLHLGADGSLLVGEAAERRAVTEPDRVVREFKRRIGDETPIVVGGVPHQAHDLAARMIAWVVDRVAEREGGRAERIAVTHPVSWGTHKKELLAHALDGLGLRVAFLAEPQAAAVSYASSQRVEPGSTFAVYDLGGGTFDAAVVRKGSGGFELLGRSEGLANLGGVDFDEAVFEHVRSGLGSALDADALDPGDETVLAAVARLRRECTEAKEALSADTEASIPVLLPGLRTTVRLVRAELEAMIRTAVGDTIEALRRAVASAGLSPTDLTAVLLVGGSSRIPLVAQLVSAELDRPIAVDADPKNAIALGAALTVSPRPNSSWPAVVVPPVPGDGGGNAGDVRPALRSFAAAADGGPRGGVARPSAMPDAPPRRPLLAPVPATAVARSSATSRPAARSARPAAPRGSRPSAGPLVGVGGLIAAVGIVAAMLLWPQDSVGSAASIASPSTSEVAEAPAGVEPADDVVQNPAPAGPIPVAAVASSARQPTGSPTTSPRPPTTSPPPVAPTTTQQPPTTDETPPVEQPPVEQPPAEQPPVEQPPAEQPPAEQPPVDPPTGGAEGEPDGGPVTASETL